MNTDEVMASEVSLVECRACLREMDHDVCMNLFQDWCTSWATPGSLVADLLSKLADIEISKYDAHSKVICPQCYSRLEDAGSFMNTVQKSDSILRNRVDVSWPKPIVVTKSLSENIDNDNSATNEIKQEVLSDDEGLHENNIDQDWEPTMDIKIEPEEIMAPVESNVEETAPVNETDMTIQVNGTVGSYEEENVNCMDNVIKEEQSSDNEMEEEPDLPLECMLCMKVLVSVSCLKEHVIEQHSYCTIRRKTDEAGAVVEKFEVKNNNENTEHKCATCREKFETRTDLMVHEACHSEHVCFVCHANFKNFKQLLRHRARCRPKSRRNNQQCIESSPVLQDSQSDVSILPDKNDSMDRLNVEPIAILKVESSMQNSDIHIKTEAEEDMNLIVPTLEPPDLIIPEKLNHIKSEQTAVKTKKENSSSSLNKTSKTDNKTYKSIISTRSQKYANNMTAKSKESIKKEEPSDKSGGDKQNCVSTRKKANLLIPRYDKSCILPDLECSSNTENYTNSRKRSRNPAKFKRDMKLHLAFNPLSNKEAVGVQNKVDMNKSSKNKDCKLRLVDISELTKKKISH